MNKPTSESGDSHRSPESDLIIRETITRAKRPHSKTPLRHHEAIDAIPFDFESREWVARVRLLEPLTTWEWLYAFIKFRRMDSGVKAYESSFSALFSLVLRLKLEDVHPSRISREHISQWMDCYGPQLRLSTLNLTLSLAKAFYGWLAEYGVMDRNPFRGIRAKREDLDFDQIRKRNARMVPPHALNQIISVIPERWHEFRVWLITLFHVGSSVKDMALLEKSSINRHELAVENIRNKTGVYYKVRIPKSVLDLMDELPTRDPKYVFPEMASRYRHDPQSLRRLFVYYKEKAGLSGSDFTLYDFRRGMVARTLSEGHGEDRTLQSLGHTKSSTMKNHYIPDGEIAEKFIYFRSASPEHER